MPLAGKFFTQNEQKLLIESIKAAELKTSGEIRIHLANFCFGSELKAAEKVFKRLKMYETQERNGVLIYIATMSRKIAIVGDLGIHEKLGQTFWEKIVVDLIDRFKKNQKADALVACILECGKQLANYFPRKENDQNELSNTISF